MRPIAFSDTSKRVAGKVTCVVRVFHEKDLPYSFETAGGTKTTYAPGVTLRQFRDQLGGDEGYVKDVAYHGGNQWVSVKHLHDADPDTTRIMLGFRFTPDRPLSAEAKALLPPPEAPRRKR